MTCTKCLGTGDRNAGNFGAMSVDFCDCLIGFGLPEKMNDIGDVMRSLISEEICETGRFDGSRATFELHQETFVTFAKSFSPLRYRPPGYARSAGYCELEVHGVRVVKSITVPRDEVRLVFARSTKL